jgi:hypothetical protein
MVRIRLVGRAPLHVVDMTTNNSGDRVVRRALRLVDGIGEEGAEFLAQKLDCASPAPRMELQIRSLDVRLV